MPLSSKLRAEYAELINQALDAIPVTRPADFRNIATILDQMLRNMEQPDCAPILKGSLETVLEYLTQPEMYVESPENYVDYQQIIKDRIQSKIAEFNSFTPDQKYQYIINQSRLKEQASAQQRMMAAAESRRAEHAQHMETEQAVLEALQRHFRTTNRDQEYNRARDFHAREALREACRLVGFNEEQLAAISNCFSGYSLNRIYRYPAEEVLGSERFSLQQLAELDAPTLKIICSSYYSSRILGGDLSLNDLLECYRQLRQVGFTNTDTSYELALIIENKKSIEAMLDGHLTAQDFAIQAHYAHEPILARHSSARIMFGIMGLRGQRAEQADDPQYSTTRSILLQFDAMIAVKEGHCTIEDLMALDYDRLMLIAWGPDTPLHALREGRVNFDTLRDLPMDELAAARRDNNYPSQGLIPR